MRDEESQLILEALHNNRMRMQTLLDELKRITAEVRGNPSGVDQGGTRETSKTH